ncbi:hypothetical protein NMY22_g11370 [Coprinellus aureogranulatus]|nr:hypothetical protein NMY22_g11370 [Coprinellus aureogranulatus]
MSLKYNPPEVIYHGYIVATDRYLEMMKQIPDYKDLMDNTEYGYNSHMRCYYHWKTLVLDGKARARAPIINEHWATGSTWSDCPATHIIFLSSLFKGVDPDRVKDRDQLLETEYNRKTLRDLVIFFQQQGVANLKEEDFEYTCSVGVHPICIPTYP